VFNPTLFFTTAFVVEHLAACPPPPGVRVLDLGTGSGALAVAAAAAGAHVVAVDVNSEAVRCARVNVLLNRCEERVEVREGDLFAAVAGERFGLVLCNPPYYPGEPTDPLDQAFRGGDFARRFAAALGDHLAAGGAALVVLSSSGDEARFLSELAGHGFATVAVAERSLPGERLTLHRVALPAS
jgi:release factor glutamine methyltransferase